MNDRKIYIQAFADRQSGIIRNETGIVNEQRETGASEKRTDNTFRDINQNSV